jgi:hypothetical protein
MGDLFQPAHLMVLFFVFLLVVPIRILPFWFICRKAGYSPWVSLLYIVPCGGLVLNFVLAFGQWRALPPAQQP